MNDFEETYLDDSFMSHDDAVMRVLSQTEKGLFDVEDERDEDLAALYEN